MAVRVAHGPLERWAGACLRAAGVPDEAASTVARCLVQTSLWGIDSHGVLRLTHYLTRLSLGSIIAKAKVTVTPSGPCISQLDGGHGLGIAHCVQGMELAIGMARQSGVGIVGVGNSSHCGAMGLYTREAAGRGLIGVAMTHSSSVVVPHGGKAKYFGTNPISIAAPREGAQPVCLDMATSQVAWNKILNARIEGAALDAGIAVDEHGVPTTDANQARAGIALGGPIYGYKGYGLAFMIELLCGPLNGMSFGPRVNDMYGQLDEHRRIGHFLLAIDPQRFAGGPMLAATVEELVKDLRTRGEILHPGEPEEIREKERRASGIPVEPVAFADMVAWSGKLRLAPPEALPPT